MLMGASNAELVNTIFDIIFWGTDPREHGSIPCHAHFPLRRYSIISILLEDRGRLKAKDD